MIHAQSTTNADPKLVVASPDLVPLTQLGINQCQELAGKLKDIQFTKIYSSPLTRAFQTANHSIDGKILPIDALAETSNFEDKLARWWSELDKAGNIAIVSHGGILGFLTNLIMKDSQKYELKNCSYHCFDIKNDKLVSSSLSNHLNLITVPISLVVLNIVFGFDLKFTIINLVWLLPAIIALFYKK